MNSPLHNIIFFFFETLTKLCAKKSIKISSCQSPNLTGLYSPFKGSFERLWLAVTFPSGQKHSRKSVLLQTIRLWFTAQHHINLSSLHQPSNSAKNTARKVDYLFKIPRIRLVWTSASLFFHIFFVSRLLDVRPGP